MQRFITAFQHSLGGLCLLMAGVALPPAGAAQVRALSFGTAIQQAWKDSPQLKELTTQSSLAQGDRWRRFLPNEPKFSYGKDHSDDSSTYVVDLSVAFPGKAFAYSQLDSAVLQKQRAELVARKSELAVLLAHAYLSCASAQATIQIKEGSLNDLESLLHSLKSRRGIIQTEKLSFELETRQTRRELVSARDAMDVSCKKLLALTGNSGSDVPTLSLPDDVDKEILSQLGSETPEEARINATINLADTNYSLAWWSQLPDFDLNYGRKETVDPTGAGRRWSDIYGISVTLPILFPFHESVEIRRTKSQAVLDKSEATLQKIQVESDRMDAARVFSRSGEYLNELRKTDLPLSQSLLESAYSAYRAGQIGYADMVLSRKTYIDLKLKEIELRTAIVTARLKCLDQCDALSWPKKDSR